ncbi:MAG: LysM peptidoglycan-binding domain-containing protein [Treponema sp.]|nr:LysM peptidoglycan-binding domain-containing protein [Treponema sp.]
MRKKMGTGDRGLGIKNNSTALVVLLCILLYSGMAGRLGAQTAQNPGDAVILLTATQGDERPLRGQSAGSVPALTTHSSLAATHYSLLTPEALEHPLTQRYIEDYTRPGNIRWLNTVIRTGSVYIPFIRDEIARHGLPPELIYLPFIESSFMSTARSRVGAVGIWQFMLNSIPHDMQVNEMIDERQDFRKSTVAALRKLAGEYRIFGDWHLTLAAYNCGVGRVRRALERTETDDYWTLVEMRELPNETIQYVPKFLAVSYILSNPRKYGIDWWPDTFEWTVIKPERQVSLTLLAAETGTDREILHRLNRELLYGITPPDRDYELVVPLSKAQAITDVLERSDTRLLLYYRYQIKYGDTLSALSRHYGISINLIEQHNPGITSRFLRIGETIVIPALREVSPYTGGSSAASAPSSASSPVPQSVPSVRVNFGGTHIVEQGDTLWSLARRYGVDPQILATENGMTLNQILSIGRVLRVPIIE